jgi:ketosteroid isomerase-like protein
MAIAKALPHDSPMRADWLQVQFRIARLRSDEMQTRTRILRALSALLLAAPLQVFAANGNSEASIERIAEAYRKAVLARDAAAIGATYAVDAVEMPPFRPPLKGRSEIEQYYRQLFDGPMQIVDFTFTHPKSTAAGSFGYITGGYRQKLLSRSGESMENSGSFVVIVKREDGAWKSSYVIYNSDRPPASLCASTAVFMNPFPALMNYYSSIASEWLNRLRVISVIIACVTAIATAVPISSIFRPLSGH